MRRPPPSPTGEVRGDALDAWSVPKVRSTVVSVELDGETVLLDEVTGAVCMLSPVATVTWACFDGSSALGEVAADLADGFHADAEQGSSRREGPCPPARRLWDVGPYVTRVCMCSCMVVHSRRM